MCMGWQHSTVPQHSQQAIANTAQSMRKHMAAQLLYEYEPSHRSSGAVGPPHHRCVTKGRVPVTQACE